MKYIVKVNSNCVLFLSLVLWRENARWRERLVSCYLRYRDHQPHGHREQRAAYEASAQRDKRLNDSQDVLGADKITCSRLVTLLMFSFCWDGIVLWLRLNTVVQKSINNTLKDVYQDMKSLKMGIYAVLVPQWSKMRLNPASVHIILCQSYFNYFKTWP